MVTREQLVFKALAAVHEAAGACHAAPVPKTFALRFALAYLFATTANGDREPFLNFWRAATGELKDGQNPGAAAISRSASAEAALNGICRFAGIQNSPVLWNVYWEARVATGSARRNPP